jgi:hypothetical protein
MQLSLAGTVIAVIAEIAPQFVTVFFALPQEYAALVFVPAGAGLVLGSLVLPPIIKRLRRSSVLVGAGVVILAACTLILTFLHSVATHVGPYQWSRSPLYFVGVLLLTFLMGFGLDLVNIPAQTTMQELSPSWIKGRVLALQNMLFNAVTVPIVLLIGLVADYLQLPPAMNLLALIVLAAGFLTIWYGRRPRHVPLVITRAPSAPEVADGALALTATAVDAQVPLLGKPSNGHRVQVPRQPQSQQRPSRKRRDPRQPTRPVG